MLALSIIAGLVLLLVGGEMLVRGAVQVANKLKMSPLLIGIVLVGFGTSTPELLTSLLAAFEEAPGIAIGNVVGSNTANILLILGIAALLSPIPVTAGKGFYRDSSFLMISALLLLAAVLVGTLNIYAGVGFLLGLVVYLWISIKQEKDSYVPDEDTVDTGKNTVLSFIIFAVGLALTMGGAKLLVSGCVTLAREFNISETVIGLTIVAVGTSLPELVASVIAGLKKHTELAYGNIVGSNIYNIFGILGITSIVHPLSVPEQIVNLDIWIMIATTIALIAFARFGWLIGRVKGAVFLGAYVAYTAWLVMHATAT